MGSPQNKRYGKLNNAIRFITVLIVLLRLYRQKNYKDSFRLYPEQFYKIEFS